MKKWRFFPILVKEEILNNMDLPDKLFFSKCSNKCQNLLRRIPNHLNTFKVPNDDHLSIDDFLMLFTSRLSTLQELELTIETAEERDQVNQFLLKLRKIQNSIKVKELFMSINPVYSKMYKEVINLCDPLTIEFITIRGLHSQEIYEYILKTPQWKNSPGIHLNLLSEANLKIDIDDFMHFKNIGLRVEELSVEDALKLAQKVRNSESDEYSVALFSQKSLETLVIRERIEAELVGNWERTGVRNLKFLKHPEKKDLVFIYECGRHIFEFESISIDRFNQWRN